MLTFVISVLLCSSVRKECERIVGGSISHRTHSGLTPSPSPNGEGSDYRDTPYTTPVCSVAYILLSADQ